MIKRVIALLLVSVLSLGLCACNKEEPEEESSIVESSGPNVKGDSHLEADESSESEESYNFRLKQQADEIRSTNTVYTQRYKDFFDKLTNSNYSIRYHYTTDINADYTYDVVHSDSDFYYKMSVTDVDGRTDGFEYFELNGIGHYYDDKNKICVVIKDTIKTLTDVIPIQSGVKFKEKKTATFKGNTYSCDVFDIITGHYTDDMQNLEPRVSGSLTVYYDDKDNVIGMYKEYIDDYSELLSIDKISAADISVFKTKEGYTELSVEKYLEKYGETSKNEETTEEGE